MLVTDPHPQVVDCATAVLRVADVELTVMPVSVSLGALPRYDQGLGQVLAQVFGRTLQLRPIPEQVARGWALSQPPGQRSPDEACRALTPCFAVCSRAFDDTAANANSCFSAAVSDGRWCAGAQRICWKPSEGVMTTLFRGVLPRCGSNTVRKHMIEGFLPTWR